MKNFLLYVLIIAFFAACNCGPYLQKTTIDYDVHHRDSAWVQLPCNYAKASDTAHYPLLIFFHGTGEAANDGNLSVMLSLGPPHYMADSIRYFFTATGASPVSKYFIVVCPQTTSGHLEPDRVNTILDKIVAKYRVDPTRVYMTGLSAGARNVMRYITASQAYANRVAAVVPMSVITLPADATSHFNYISNAGIHVKIFCGTTDAIYSANQGYITSINALSPGLGEFVSYSAGHCCWNGPYEPKHTYYNPNMYEWLLQFHK